MQEQTEHLPYAQEQLSNAQLFAALVVVLKMQADLVSHSGCLYIYSIGTSPCTVNATASNGTTTRYQMQEQTEHLPYVREQPMLNLSC
jgi:hypothetical protein